MLFYGTYQFGVLDLLIQILESILYSDNLENDESTVDFPPTG
jgi:hypothetical protein